MKGYTLEHIDIEVNHRCNLACRHCSARAAKGKLPEEMSVEDMKRILFEGKDLGLKKIGLTGGEPLFDIPRTEEIAKFCLDRLNKPIHTHTNGTLVKEEHCKKGGVLTLFENVSVTFLGGNADTHDNMTKTKGSFEKSIRGAYFIAKAGLPFTCYYIPTRGTCEEFKELTTKLKEIGVKRIRAMALAPSGRARGIYEETAPANKEIRQFETDLMYSRDKLGIHIEAGYCTRLSMPRLSVLNDHEQCMSGRNRVHINSKGDVFPCTAASGVKELRLGNVVRNGMHIKDIWLNSSIINTIRKIHNGALAACATCTREPKCQVGCTVNACGTMSEEVQRICPLMIRATESRPISFSGS